MVAKKRKSKRQTLQQKFKIIKRTQEHHKRIKKGAIVSSGKKKSVDNHIPNAWPYKEELLKEIQSAKDKMEEVRVRQMEKRHEEMAKRRAGGSMVAEFVPEERARNQLNVPSEDAMDEDDDGDMDADEDEYDGAEDIKTASLGQNSRRAFLRELRKVVESGDVILHVLDARDPMGTKSKAIEDIVLANSRKKLVYVLNKADLVPRDVLIGWLAYLRKFHAAVPFKCNTQSQKVNLGSTSGKASRQQESALQTNQAVGAEELIGLLKNYARNGDTKTVISVGIVGFPNVGKSSLINSLMRSRAVSVSSMPGHTRVTQEVILDKNIRLIDSPGIVFADGDSAATSLRNCVNIEELEDVLTPVQAIMDRCPKTYLMQLYNVPRFRDGDCVGFLALVARATGKLKKGGIPNTDSAARSILHDWNNGKIKYYCTPPDASVTAGGGAGEGDSKVLSGFSEGMDVEALRDEDIRVLDLLQAVTSAAAAAGGGSGGAGGGAESSKGFVAMDSSSLAPSAATVSSTDALIASAIKPSSFSSSSSSSVSSSAAAAAAASIAAIAAVPRVPEGSEVKTRRKKGSDKGDSNDVDSSLSVFRADLTAVTAPAAGLRATGVLARAPATTSSSTAIAGAGAVDARKTQKKLKKKSLKAQRRDQGGADGEGGEGEGQEEAGDYDFSADFSY